MYIPVVNVGKSDVLLYPPTEVGALREVCVVSLPSGVQEVPLYHHNQLLGVQVIRESCSPFASPNVLVKKKTEVCACVSVCHVPNPISS